MSAFKRIMPVLGLALILGLAPAMASLAGARYLLTQMTMSIYYALATVGLCLLMGYAGQISMGHAGFMAIGGYTSSVLTTCNLIGHAQLPAFSLLERFGVLFRTESADGVSPAVCVAPWAAFLAAIILTIAIALLIGMPVLRLKGHYLAMATMGFGIIVHRMVIGFRALGEADGISGVPAFPVLPGAAISGVISDRLSNYLLAAAALVAGVWLLQNLVHSRAGRALRAIRGSEEAAEAAGVDTARYKLMTFVLSAVFAAAAGSFLAHYNGGIGPSEAGVMKSVRAVALVALGGMANLWGTLFSSLILNFLSLRGVFQSYDDAVFGAILIAAMVFAPHGRIPFFTANAAARAWRRLTGRRGRGGDARN